MTVYFLGMIKVSIFSFKTACKTIFSFTRYPYVQIKEDDDQSKNDNKKNPYSIALLEEQQKEGNSIRLAGLETASMNVQLESDEVLSSLFACKLELANQKFELKINDVRFVSHPALMETKNFFILINIVFALQAQCSYSIGDNVNEYIGNKFQY